MAHQPSAVRIVIEDPSLFLSAEKLPKKWRVFHSIDVGHSYLTLLPLSFLTHYFGYLEADSLAFLSAAAPLFVTAVEPELNSRVAASPDNSLVRWLHRYEISLAPGPRTDDALAYALEEFPDGEAQIWFALCRFVRTTRSTSVREVVTEILPLCAGAVPSERLRPHLLATLDHTLAAMFIRSSWERPLDCLLLESDAYDRSWCDWFHEDDYADEVRLRPTFCTFAKYLIAWSG